MKRDFPRWWKYRAVRVRVPFHAERRLRWAHLEYAGLNHAPGHAPGRCQRAAGSSSREPRCPRFAQGSFRWLFLETAMLATGALRCPLDREGLLGAETNSSRRPTDGCRAEELPWRPTAPTQALSSLRNSLRQRGPGRSPLRGAGRAGSPKSGACCRSARLQRTACLSVSFC